MLRRCRHPRCDRDNGNPTITNHGICEHCQQRLRKLLTWVVLDWVDLTHNLPTPTPHQDVTRRSAQQAYGHPAEWASDTARTIADILNDTHDALAEALGETPPPHPGITDQIRVRAAWNYLEPRISALAKQDWATDTITELHDIHKRIRSRLGHTQPRQVLATPCPACELRTVTRTLNPHRDQIECGACGWCIQPEDYQHFAKAVLDAITTAPDETDQVYM